MRVTASTVLPASSPCSAGPSSSAVAMPASSWSSGAVVADMASGASAATSLAAAQQQPVFGPHACAPASAPPSASASLLLEDLEALFPSQPTSSTATSAAAKASSQSALPPASFASVMDPSAMLGYKFTAADFKQPLGLAPVGAAGMGADLFPVSSASAAAFQLSMQYLYTPRSSAAASEHFQHQLFPVHYHRAASGDHAYSLLSVLVPTLSTSSASIKMELDMYEERRAAAAAVASTSSPSSSSSSSSSSFSTYESPTPSPSTLGGSVTDSAVSTGTASLKSPRNLRPRSALRQHLAVLGRSDDRDSDSDASYSGAASASGRGSAALERAAAAAGGACGGTTHGRGKQLGKMVMKPFVSPAQDDLSPAEPANPPTGGRRTRGAAGASGAGRKAARKAAQQRAGCFDSKRKWEHSHTGQEPSPEQFASKEEYETAWKRWRRLRDQNNESVKRSRENKRRAEELGCRQEQCVQHVGDLSRMQDQLALVLKAIRSPEELTDEEKEEMDDIVKSVSDLAAMC